MPRGRPKTKIPTDADDDVAIWAQSFGPFSRKPSVSLRSWQKRERQFLQNAVGTHETQYSDTCVCQHVYQAPPGDICH